MKKFLSSAAAAFLIAGGLTIGAATAASAEELEVCTPSDAWTEVIADIEHPAVVEYVEHEAVTHEVEHAAVYETVIITPAVDAIPEVAEVSHVEYQWKWWGWVDHGVTVWTDGSYPSADANKWGGEWKKNGKERKVITTEFKPGVPAVEAVTEQRLVTEAWVEIVVDEEAWTEEIIVKDAWTEVVPDVEHAAVECPLPEEPVTEEPVVEETEVVDQPVQEAAAANALAETGYQAGWLPLAAVMSLIVGAGILVARKLIPAKE